MKNSNERGSVLVVTLILFGIIIITALSVALTSLRQIKTSMQSSKTNIAYQNADEGIDKVMTAILKGKKAVVSDGSGDIRVESVMGSVSGAQCDSATGNIKPLSESDYEVELWGSCTDSGGASYPFKIDCDAADATISTSNSYGTCASSAVANDISEIVQLKSTGNDNAVGTQRIVGANIQQKSRDVLLLMHMDTNTFPDNSRYHAEVNKRNDVDFESLADAKFGGSAFFDNDDSSTNNIALSVENNGNMINFGTGPFTIDFWARFVKKDDGKDQTQTIFGADEQIGGDGIAIEYKETDKIIKVRYGSMSIPADFPLDDPYDDDFHHIAIVRFKDGTKNELQVYWDGKGIKTSPYEEPSTPYDIEVDDTEKLYIGGNSVSTSGFSGYIDEFRIYKGAWFNDKFDVDHLEPY